MSKQRIRQLQSQIDSANRELRALTAVVDGTKPSAEIQRRIDSQRFSYTVEFVRKNGQTFTSKRRFSSSKEAGQHGTRFAKKHKHQEATVVRVNQRANAWINWETGKTNPAV